MKTLATCAFFLSQSKAIINDAIKRFDIRPFRPPCYLALKPVRSRTVSHAGHILSFIFYFGSSVVVEIGGVVMTPVDRSVYNTVFVFMEWCIISEHTQCSEYRYLFRWFVAFVLCTSASF